MDEEPEEEQESRPLGITPMGLVYLGWVLFIVIVTGSSLLMKGCFSIMRLFE